MCHSIEFVVVLFFFGVTKMWRDTPSDLCLPFRVFIECHLRFLFCCWTVKKKNVRKTTNYNYETAIFTPAGWYSMLGFEWRVLKKRKKKHFATLIFHVNFTSWVSHTQFNTLYAFISLFSFFLLSNFSLNCWLTRLFIFPFLFSVDFCYAFHVSIKEWLKKKMKKKKK